MARVTIEDCLEEAGGHFKVVCIAAARARQLELGKSPLVDRSTDKSTVIALREVAEKLVDENVLNELPEDLVDTPVAGANVQAPGEDLDGLVANTGPQAPVSDAATAAGVAQSGDAGADVLFGGGAEKHGGIGADAAAGLQRRDAIGDTPGEGAPGVGQQQDGWLGEDAPRNLEEDQHPRPDSEPGE